MPKFQLQPSSVLYKYFIHHRCLFVFLTISVVTTTLCIICGVNAIDDKEDEFVEDYERYEDSMCFICSLVAGIVVSIPMLLELFTDLYLYNKSDFFVLRGCTYNILIILAIMLPDVILYTFLLPGKRYVVINTVLLTRWSFVMTMSVAFLSKYGGAIWSRPTSFIIVTLVNISGPLKLYPLLIDDDELVRVFSILYYIVLVASVALHFYQCLRWVRHILSKPSKEIMTLDEVCCNIYVCFTVSVTIGIAALYWWFYGDDDEHFTIIPSAKSYSAHTMVYCVCLVVLWVLYSATLRKEAATSQKELQFHLQFAKHLSYIIHEPLNVMSTNLQLLEEDLSHGFLTAEDILLSVIETRMHSLHTTFLLNDLLLFERLEDGVLTLDKTVVNAWDFLTHAIHPFSYQAKQCGVNLSVSLLFDDESVSESYLRSLRINIDKQKMSQVIRNVLSNALQLTPRGGLVTVQMSVERVERVDGGHGVDGCDSMFVRIDVTDTGPGISKEKQSELFIAISRGSNSQRSGLGLYISNGIVKLHKGKLAVFSSGDGYGSTFSVLLSVHDLAIPGSVHSLSDNSENVPMEPQLSPTATVGSSRVEIVSIASPPFVSRERPFRLTTSRKNFSTFMRHVEAYPNESLSLHPPSGDTKSLALVVDDFALHRRMHCRMLQGEYTCVEAESGVEALEKVRSSLSTDSEAKFALILIDNVMPVWDGPTTITMIRSLGYTGIIFGLQSHARAATTTRFLSHGADDVLTKPLDKESFDGAVHRAQALARDAAVKPKVHWEKGLAILEGEEDCAADEYKQTVDLGVDSADDASSVASTESSIRDVSRVEYPAMNTLSRALNESRREDGSTVLVMNEAALGSEGWLSHLERLTRVQIDHNKIDLDCGGFNSRVVEDVCLPISSQQGFQRNHVQLIFARSEVLQLQGRQSEASSLLLDTLKRLETQPDGVSDGDGGGGVGVRVSLLQDRIACHRRLGCVYHGSGSFLSAEEQLREALACLQVLGTIRTDMSDGVLQGSLLALLSSVLVELGRDEEAVDVDRRAMRSVVSSALVPSALYL